MTLLAGVRDDRPSLPRAPVTEQGRCCHETPARSASGHVGYRLPPVASPCGCLRSPPTCRYTDTMRRFTVLLLVRGRGGAGRPRGRRSQHADRPQRDAHHAQGERQEPRGGQLHANGIVHHVLVWGAINAKPPDPAHPDSQVKFHFDYSGGTGQPLGQRLLAARQERLHALEGQRRSRWAVTVCTMPDGSHWALQRWRRLMPNGGWPCCLTPQQGKHELHISHWKGALAQFWLKWDWTHATSQYPHLDKLFGRATYKGVGTYGFSNTSTGAPTDSFGRLVYRGRRQPAEVGQGLAPREQLPGAPPQRRRLLRHAVAQPLRPHQRQRLRREVPRDRGRPRRDADDVLAGPAAGQLLAVDPCRPATAWPTSRSPAQGGMPFDAMLDSQLDTEQHIAGRLIRRQVLHDPLAATR